MNNTECEDCGRNRPLTLIERRYAFLRAHPAWQSESFLAGLTPSEFDAEVDKEIVYRESLTDCRRLSEVEPSGSSHGQGR